MWVAISPLIEGIWTYPGGEAKPMHMVFDSGGTLSFQAGFENYNPSSWQYNPASKLLKIKVTVRSKDELLPMLKNIEIQNANRRAYEQLDQGLIEEVLPEAGEVTFRLGETPAIAWMGWVYFKNGESRPED